MLASAPRGQLVLDRGRTLTTAWETGLKLEETCLRPVHALSYADFKRGPKAFLDEEIASVVVAPSDGPVLTGLTELVRTVAAAHPSWESAATTSSPASAGSTCPVPTCQRRWPRSV